MTGMNIRNSILVASTALLLAGSAGVLNPSYRRSRVFAVLQKLETMSRMAGRVGRDKHRLNRLILHECFE